RQARRADVADRLTLFHALAHVQAASERRQVTVAGADAVRVAHLDHVAVAALFAAHPGHLAIGRGAHRRAVRCGEVHTLVVTPHTEDGMEPAAEPARDAAERERRATARAPQRPPLIAVEARDAGAAVPEVAGVTRRPGHVQARRDHPTEAALPLRRL